MNVHPDVRSPWRSGGVAASSTLEAGIHGWTPFVPGRTGRTRTRAGRALVPYRCAGAPAIDDACAAASTVAARPATIGRAYLTNADGHGKNNHDQYVPHGVSSTSYSFGPARSEVLFYAPRCNGRCDSTLPRCNVSNPPKFRDRHFGRLPMSASRVRALSGLRGWDGHFGRSCSRLPRRRPVQDDGRSYERLEGILI